MNGSEDRERDDRQPPSGEPLVQQAIVKKVVVEGLTVFSAPVPTGNVRQSPRSGWGPLAYHV